MSGNQVVNAGFADGITGWTSALPLVADDNIFGYEGRLVLRGTKVGAFANAETANISANPTEAVIGLIAGQTLEAFGHHAFTRGTSQLAVNFYTGADVLVTSVPVPVVKVGDGDPRLGLAKSYSFSHARIIVPATATKARLVLYGTAVGPGTGSLLLMKPYLEQLPSPKTTYRCWDPGPSINEDLELSVWPPELPHIRGDSFEATPIPTRKGFAGDAGVMMTKKVLTIPWYQARGQVKVTQETQAILDQFFRNATSPFWFVRPDTLQLCQATWVPDGEPTYGGAGSDKTASFAIQMRVL